jgi:hypothetical protein
MYERRSEKLLSRPEFAKRVLRHVGAAAAAVGAALAIGVAGYYFLADLSWVDALLNASMILAGMGPVNPLPTVPAKIFASAYALFSGLIFIGVSGLVLAPFFHRIFHRFHLDES